MPEKFHQYHLTKTLNKKNSHTTYLASPISKPECQVVLTVFASSLFRFPHEREHLLQRAQRLKQLQHSHLVPILDMEIEEEQPFVVREYLPNESLRSCLNDLLVTNPFVWEEVDASPVMASGSIHEYSEYATAEETLLLPMSSDVGKPRPVWPLHGRGRVLGLAVLLSVIVVLIGYIFLPLMMTMLKTSSYIADKQQVVVPQSTSISMPLVSGQVIAFSTVQPAVPPPTTRSAVVATNIPISTPATPRSYEAESQQNTQGSGIHVFDCSYCSGGERVGDINECPTYCLQFNNVWEPSTSNYTLTIYYVISGTDTLSLSMSVNDEPEITFNVPSTPNDSTVGTDSVTVGLKAGNNTIRFSNHSEKYWGPDLDRIVV